MPGPLQPLLEQLERFLKGKLEDKAEVLLEEMSTEERLVDPLEPAELADLFVCQVLGVLPERVAGAPELASANVITTPMSWTNRDPVELVLRCAPEVARRVKRRPRGRPRRN